MTLPSRHSPAWIVRRHCPRIKTVRFRGGLTVTGSGLSLYLPESVSMFSLEMHLPYFHGKVKGRNADISEYTHEEEKHSETQPSSSSVLRETPARRECQWPSRAGLLTVSYIHIQFLGCFRYSWNYVRFLWILCRPNCPQIHHPSLQSLDYKQAPPHLAQIFFFTIKSYTALC